MKKAILLQIFLFFSLCISTAFAQTGWVQQTTGIHFTVNDMLSLDNNTGFAVTGSNIITNDSGCVIRTTNGGLTWSTILGPFGYAIKKITHRPSDNKIYLGTGETLETSNGGVSWYTQSSLIPAHTALQFFDANLAVVNYESFTTNGGANWTSHGTPPSGGYGFDYKFINLNTGYGVGGGYANKTINSGLQWNECFPAAINSNLWSADAYNDKRIIFSGNSDVWYTTNGGTTDWNHIGWGVLYGHSLYKIKYLDSANILTVSNKGGIFRSNNSGENWLPQVSDTSSALRNIYFLNLMTGWVMGDKGKVLKTTTGGWGPTSVQPNNEIVKDFTLSQNYPNPFNPSTVINYQLSVAGNVSLNVYDVNGKFVRVIASGFKQQGSYDINFSADGLSSGIYYYSLNVDGVVMDTKKMMLLK